MSLLNVSALFIFAVQDDTLRLLDSTRELPILGWIIGDESSMVRWLSCIDNANISPAKCALTDLACLHLFSRLACVYGRQLQPLVQKVQQCHDMHTSSPEASFVSADPQGHHKDCHHLPEADEHNQHSPYFQPVKDEPARLRQTLIYKCHWHPALAYQRLGCKPAPNENHWYLHGIFMQRGNRGAKKGPGPCPRLSVDCAKLLGSAQSCFCVAKRSTQPMKGQGHLRMSKSGCAISLKQLEALPGCLGSRIVIACEIRLINVGKSPDASLYSLGSSLCNFKPVAQFCR